MATNATLFPSRGDFHKHSLRVAVQEKLTLDQFQWKSDVPYLPEQYIKPDGEMKALFDDLPVVIDNTRIVAASCTKTFDLGKVALPHYPVNKGETEEQCLESMSKKGLQEKFELVANRTAENEKELLDRYEQRLDYELGVIKGMGFAGYFLVVADFINWAKSKNIPVGPGRGSGAGSMVAYCIGITELDPIQYDLVFERFLNPERVSMPDFDVDFCMDRRDEVIEYTAAKYGVTQWLKSSPLEPVRPDRLYRTLPRVLGKPYSVGEQISRAIPDELGITLQAAKESSSDLQSCLSKRRWQTSLRPQSGWKVRLGALGNMLVVSLLPPAPSLTLPPFIKMKTNHLLCNLIKTTLSRWGWLNLTIWVLET